jgi:poly(3-hydroxybutyrate) depolymerase
VCGEEAAVLAALKRFFHATDPAEREELARRIESDPVYDRARVSEWLHAAGLFTTLEPGRMTINVELLQNYMRRVVLRIPRAYDPRRPWPLIYALHGTGDGAEGLIAYVERILGEAVDEFVVAAPQDYREWIVHGPWPPMGEHPAVLRAVRKQVHVDSDRTYVLGYSRGGHACWTLAILYPDLFAGAVPLAGSLLLPEIEGLRPQFLPSLAHTPVLCVWGAADVLDAEGKPSPQGGVAALNRALTKLAQEQKLPVIGIEMPDAGHRDVLPPQEELRRVLSNRRVRFPREVQHAFRDLSQARAWWLEGETWAGPQWDNAPMKLEFRPGEYDVDPKAVRAASLRAYRGRLGGLSGRISGQGVRVTRKNLSEVTVWFGDGMVDWQQPVQLNMGGLVSEQHVRPDLLLCLARAAQEYDLDRLLWAGLRYRSGDKARVITARDLASP